jgi:Flp pilus assembly protein CpaB
MGTGRILVIIGIVVLVGAAVVGVILWRRAQQPEPAPVSVEDGTTVPYTPPVEGMEEIVVAAQNIPRGTRITAENGAAKMESWPETAVPEGALVDLEDAYGLITRVEVVRDMPITEGMLTEEPGDLGGVGSDAALQIPEGKVAYALPVARYSSVAWAIQPGDHVDVIISLLVVELDEEFQTIMPNQANCVSPSEEEGCRSGVLGRLEALPNGWVVNLVPGEVQRPRLVTQLTVQDAVVLRVGEWVGEEGPPPSEEEQVEGEGEEQPAPTPSRAAVEPLTLIVTPQDAMVLKYAEEGGASIDLVLRSASDADKLVPTESVTLQYIFDRFNVELPPKLPYGVAPAVQSLERRTVGGAASEGGVESLEQ